jgi:hypothetical protein
MFHGVCYSINYLPFLYRKMFERKVTELNEVDFVRDGGLVSVHQHSSPPKLLKI